MIMASICCVEGFQNRGTPDSSSQSVTSFSSCLRASSLALSSVAEISPVSRRVSFGLGQGPAAEVAEPADDQPAQESLGGWSEPVDQAGARAERRRQPEDAQAG